MTEPAVPLDTLPGLPRDQDGPVFNKPWEAQAFALPARLSEAGDFTWGAWAATLSRQNKAAQARGDPDLGHTYYTHWLGALEQLGTAKDHVGAQAKPPLFFCLPCSA